MIILLITFICLYAVKLSLCLTGKVCSYKSEGLFANSTWVEYCCIHTENRNGVCTECPIGYWSLGYESKCAVCNPGWYGLKCTMKCNCEISRCNNVNGCKEINAETKFATTAAAYKGQIFTDGTNETQTYYTESSTINKESINTHDMLVTNEVKTVTNHFDSITIKSVIAATYEISTREKVIYCIAVACLLLVVGLCFIFNNYRLKSQRKRLEILQRIEVQNAMNDSENTQRASGRIEEEIYHEIDETKMCDFVSVKKPEVANVYLEVINSSSESGSSLDQNENPDEYLHSYHSLLENHDSHQYEQANLLQNSFVEVTSSDSSTLLPDTDNQGYLHMYQPLHPPRQLCAKQSTICGLFTSSSASDIEIDVKKTYCKTYQKPLNKTNSRNSFRKIKRSISNNDVPIDRYFSEHTTGRAHCQTW